MGDREGGALCGGFISRGSTRRVVKRALVAGVVAAPLLFGTATAGAQSFDDPANDVLAVHGRVLNP